MRTNKSDLLNISLTQLVRATSDKLLSDTIELVNQILTPVSRELDRATHKFSTDLFILTIIYALDECMEEGTLKKALQYLVNLEKFKTEKKMLSCISTPTRLSMRHPNVVEALKKFAGSISGMSEGGAKRLVLACYLQWRKGLNMPELTDKEKATYGFASPTNNDELGLHNIRIGTRYELSDATKLATKILKPVQNQTDKTTYEFAQHFLISVSLCTVSQERNPTMDDVLLYAIDPRWDSHKQMLLYPSHIDSLKANQSTKKWLEDFIETALALPEVVSISLIKRSHSLWMQALSLTSPTAKTSNADPVNSVQIFSLSALAAATTAASELHADRSGGAVRILNAAQKNNGFRTLPDPKKAYTVLEAAKSEFENLIAPISYLQKNMVLSAAMGAKNFRVRPVLLLGDPGIGKTYLAMALAKSLGGAMEKVSAGGAGFALNGSQSTWTGGKCGQVFRALAESETTSPVFIIDEIDKMGEDERYPILPVILELLEPGTAAMFKDEFFEMDFDASRIIFILTAKNLNTVPEALRSRVEIFNVPRPDVVQRMRIIKAELKELRAATGQQIQLDTATSITLANRLDIDIRRTNSIVRDAFTQALMDNQKTAMVIIPDDSPCNNKIGFLLGDFSTKKIKSDVRNPKNSRKSFVCSLDL